jgi:hypothetical protein
MMAPPRRDDHDIAADALAMRAQGRDPLTNWRRRHLFIKMLRITSPSDRERYPQIATPTRLTSSDARDPSSTN